jgi:hypothetical protein
MISKVDDETFEVANDETLEEARKKTWETSLRQR